MFKKIIVVIFENTAYESIVGNTKEAPFFNKIARRGALMTQSYGMTHPSQPNYMYLFSGDSCGVKSNDCKDIENVPNLYTQLALQDKRFIGYSEDLPFEGSRIGRSGHYARKHSPWASFANVPDECNLPFETHFPFDDFDALPDVCFITPNLMHDIHDGTIAQGDAWLKDQLGPLFKWVKDNDSLIIITFDEDDGKHDNHIFTCFYGANIVAGEYDYHMNHVDVYEFLTRPKCIVCHKDAVGCEESNWILRFCGKNCQIKYRR